MNNKSQSPQQQSLQQPQGVGLLVVRATHEYIPVNNDELHIRPNDIITITNPEEGGWWEGTLGSKTGWFPSNYVVPLDPTGVVAVAQTLSSPEPQQTAEEYRHTIVQELVESESRFISEMEDFLDGTFPSILTKIESQTRSESSSILLQSLKSSYSCVVAAHTNHILNPLKNHVLSTSQSCNLRVGKIFLTAAPNLQTAHTSYCKLHPKFVSLIEKHQDILSGAQEPDGVLRIITCLSAPFRRIVAYGGLLNELECHVESFHQDRGDLQRSVAFYRELEKSLSNLRKQKEMELEVLVPGAIKDYEGSEITSLGEIMLMNLLFVGKERLPRYFVLFPNTIVILAYDSLDNQFSYHGRICVSGVAVASLPDGEYQGFPVANTIEISGPTIHPVIAQCPTPSIKSTWISTLTDLIRKTRCYSNSNNGSNTNSLSAHQFPQASIAASHNNQNHNSHLLHVGAPLAPPLQAWNITRLRPSPPYNPFLAEYLSQGSGSPSKLSLATRSSSSTNFGSGSNNNSINLNMNKSKSGSFSGMASMGTGMHGGTTGVTNEDDFAVLSIVDAFCNNNGRGQQQILRKHNEDRVAVAPTLPPPPSSLSSSKSLQFQNHLNLNYSRDSGQSSVKSLPHLVLLLRDDITNLNDRITHLTRQLEDETSARMQLMNVIGKIGSCCGGGGGGSGASSNSGGGS